MDIVVGSSQISVGGSLYVFENRLDPQDISEAGLTISGSGNVALRLSAPDGALLSRARNTLPGAEYYQRNADDGGAIDEFLSLSVAQRGAYTLTAVPNVAYSAEETFSLELKAEGVKRRLAKDMPMRPEGYSFKLYPSGSSPHLPENGAFVPEAVPGFVIGTADGFDIELSTDYTFSSILDSASVTGTFYSPSISLGGSDTALYYWRYRLAGRKIWTSPIALNVTAVASPVCGDVDGSGRVNIADIVYGISNMFAAGPPPLDRARGDVDVSGTFDVSDAILMIAYVFTNGSAPACP